ncbi:OsmC family peroxiredoxin [Plantibacter sp. YIM 135249]|uniref:OsmC family peroxiredoxin n=1 Tax=Plantibacter sp. YIM 135249 TaxID=3423918 RepID=UPI003D34A694
MALTSIATATWQGSLSDGTGATSLESSGEGPFPLRWTARSPEAFNGALPEAVLPDGTTPEDFLGAAHAACFSMVISQMLAEAGFCVEVVATTATVSFTPGIGVARVHLRTIASVPDLTPIGFQRIAREARDNCPLSLALAGTPVTLEATLR